MRRIGLISDTHGLLRPEAIASLDGCDHIIHAGDIGTAHILGKLAEIAPVTAVRGNNDHGAWADALPETASVRIGGIHICTIHDIAQLDPDALNAAVRVVVFGHSHKPAIEWRNGVLYVNPGSAGPRRFRLPVSIGELLTGGQTPKARLVELECAAAGKRPRSIR